MRVTKIIIILSLLDNLSISGTHAHQASADMKNLKVLIAWWVWLCVERAF
jgi:hypothetical protein